MLIEKTINEPSEGVAQALLTADDIVMQKAQEIAEAEMLVAQAAGLRKPPKIRAGITTNKGNGTPKAKRKMAAQSKRKNRKAA